MSELETILLVARVVFAFVVILFLPGFLLVNALFPKKRELDEREPVLVRLVFSVVLSIACFIAIGFVLNSLGVNQNTGKGYFSAPYILLSLGILCLVLFLLGAWRGAYPFLYDPLKARTGVKVDRARKHDMERLRNVRLSIADMKRRVAEAGGEKEKERLSRKVDELESERKELIRGLSR